MKSKSTEYTPVATRRTRRIVPGHIESAQEHAMPEAFDEIFAHLALRQEQLERSTRDSLEADRIRETADEMDRQHGRLAKLLRDIDLSA